MKQIEKDLIIIGAGPGGYVAAISAAKKGIQVTLIDKSYIGGTCLNVGCIPTKALLHASRVYYESIHSSHIGVLANDIVFDLNQAVNYKTETTNTLVKGITYLLDKYNIETIKGEASFVNDKLIRVKMESEEIFLKGKNIIIATGSQTKHLPIEGIDLEGVLDSTGLLDNTNKIDELTIVGGGIIGLEFAFMYAQIGVKVNVIEFLNVILPSIDKDVSLRLHRYAKQLGIQLNLGAKVLRIEKLESGLLRTHYLQKEKEYFVDSDLVLEAVGRTANLESLTLQNTGIEHDNRQVFINDACKTNIEGVYAIGDVTNKMQLAHVASHQALVVIDQIQGRETTMEYNKVPSVIFTFPQIASVGLNEETCKNNEIAYVVKKVPFSANGRALVEDNSLGFIKYILNESEEEILGATVFGKDAEHLITVITMMMQNNLTFKQVKEQVFAHPTTSELIHEGALGVLKEAIHYVD